ncbi:uncharacterized protein LOC118292456 [Scophthalmus maximus]|uniref:uncharacterized protein LOC118292456 n=1 Tax=Scophthalmus maximus TaxID=52904 RepID=UPI001FA858D5|nr:uncharacterized protein LOC118292456 [Scophthalmus maximus]
MTVNAAQLDASYGVRSTEATCWHQHSDLSLDFSQKKKVPWKAKVQGLKTHGTPYTKTWKTFVFYTYLLNTTSETTPTSSEEFELSQAGLGKRHLTMSRDMSHEEFIGLLQNEYPKMQGLKGGWLLYKATGGQGKRRLIMIPPDSDAYTGTLIRSATTAGKITLYISPLQHEFDLSPLPPDAIEFQSMPRAQCQTCNVSFPLQILALHVQECMESQAGSEDIETCQSEVQLVSVTSPSPCTVTQRHLLMRGKEDCRMAETTAMSQGNGDEQIKGTVGEILAVSFAQGGPAPTFFSPWTYSYLCNWQINTTVLKSDAVADVQLQGLIDQVDLSTEDSIQGLSDEILNCGYTGAISVQNKESIVRAIILHAVLRLQPMLEQLREGLQLYDLLLLMSHYPEICQPLFVPQEDAKVNAEFVMTSIVPQLVDNEEIMNFIQDFFYEAEAEERGHGDDKDGPHSITPARFLQWITGQGHVPLLPLEQDFVVTIKFNHDCSADFGHHNVCYPVVSACAKTIVLSVRHMNNSQRF